MVKVNAMAQDNPFHRLAYDPATGIVVGVKGKPVGVKYPNGYLVVSVRDSTNAIKREYAHRLAFLLQGKEVPDLVDHIDGDKTNNKWANLRPANKSLNALNCVAPRKDNTSGFRGVYFDKRRQKFVSTIRINGKNKQLGYFKTAEEASEKYKQFKQDLVQTA